VTTDASSGPPRLVRTIAELRALLGAHRRQGHRIGFVPTMGYLHAGHVALMTEARARTDVVVVSIFVNPTQFAPNEDLAVYPRDLPRDLAACAGAEVAYVFHPDVAEMYPSPGATVVQVPSLSRGLCGRSRPSHFAGVCTVVSKLFNIVQPDVAVFGQKDYQQLAVIRQMVRDLDFPVEIVGEPTMREADGLAMSSRNGNLTPETRQQALVLSRGLFAARDRFLAGERDQAALCAVIEDTLRSAPLVVIDYIEVVDADSLEAMPEQLADRAVIAIACKVGPTRLIDNILLDAAQAPGATP